MLAESLTTHSSVRSNESCKLKLEVFCTVLREMKLLPSSADHHNVLVMASVVLYVHCMLESNQREISFVRYPLNWFDLLGRDLQPRASCGHNGQLNAFKLNISVNTPSRDFLYMFNSISCWIFIGLRWGMRGLHVRANPTNYTNSIFRPLFTIKRFDRFSFHKNGSVVSCI